MTTTKPTGRFSGRTKLITIASIVAVGASAAFAVGANIGILNAADSTNVGELTAVGDLTTPNTQVVDVYLDDTTTTATSTVDGAVTAGVSAGVPQAFAVDAAGTVALVATDAGVRLDSVTPSEGWTWTLSQTQPTELMMTFTNGVRTLEFIGTAGADGNIVGSVTEPIVTAAPGVTSTPSDDAYESEDDAHEHEDEYEDEYEGGDDDD